MNAFAKKCKIERNDELGRFVVAVEDIKAGETLLLEQPLLILPNIGERRCANCFKLTETFCSNCCILPLCGECKQHNEFDCEFFAKQTKSESSKILKEHPDIYTSLKCLLLHENPETLEYFQEFLNLEAHLKERRDTEVWLELEKNVIEPLMKSGILEAFKKIGEQKIDSDFLQYCYGVIDVNSFEIRAPDVASMRAIYLNAEILSHNCVANTTIAIDDQYQLKIYANRDIQKDEKLNHCYTNVLLGTEERRHLLQMGKYFLCKCERCEDPTELGSHMSSLICSPCAVEQRNGYIVKSREDPRQWKCLKCGHALRTEFVDSILERAKEENFHAKDDIYRYELLHAKLSRILHPNHYLMVDMKQNIASILRSIIMNLAQRPGRKVYERKVRLCHEILAVLQIIQPGISRLKAIAMYELANTLAELGRMKFGEQEMTEADLLKCLQQCENMLRESVRMLLYEPLETPEGKLAKSMLKELKDLQNDMKMLPTSKAVEEEMD